MNKKLEDLAKKNMLLNDFLRTKKANELVIASRSNSDDEYDQGVASGLRIANQCISRNIRWAFEIYKGA